MAEKQSDIGKTGLKPSDRVKEGAESLGQAIRRVLNQQAGYTEAQSASGGSSTEAQSASGGSSTEAQSASGGSSTEAQSASGARSATGESGAYAWGSGYEARTIESETDWEEDVSDKELEELSAKCKDVVADAVLAHERILKDQGEIEQLKQETRAILRRLRVA